MAYLIDSDWVIDYLEGDFDALSLMNELSQEGISISIITYMEVKQGVLRSPNPIVAEDQFGAFLAGTPILPFSTDVAERCAILRETLRRQGKRVNPRVLDLMNAATALQYGLTMVTRNIADYSDIPDLVLYDLQAP